MEVRAGNVADWTFTPGLIAPRTAAVGIGDRGYDSATVVTQSHATGARAVIPSRRGQKHPRQLDKTLYKARNQIERFFNQLKQWRGLATRYEKTTASFVAMLYLICARRWLL